MSMDKRSVAWYVVCRLVCAVSFRVNVTLHVDGACLLRLDAAWIRQDDEKSTFG